MSNDGIYTPPPGIPEQPQVTNNLRRSERLKQIRDQKDKEEQDEINIFTRQPPKKRRKLNHNCTINNAIAIKFHPWKHDKSFSTGLSIRNPSKFAIGSDPSKCSVVCRHPEVLPIHAEVTYDKEHQTLFIRAMDPKGDIFVNDLRICAPMRYALKHGDKIQLGRHSIDSFVNEFKLEMIQKNEEQNSIAPPQWSCKVCTLLNDDTCAACVVCGHIREMRQKQHVNIPLQTNINITQQQNTTKNITQSTATKTNKQKTHTSTNTNQYIWSWYDNHHYVSYSDTTSKALNTLPIGNIFVFTIGKKTYEITKITETKGEQRNVSTNYKRDVKRTTSIIFVPNMKRTEVLRLAQGNQVDHRDFLGKYHEAQIIERSDTMVKIHYIGWNESYDVWNDCAAQYQRFASLGSISNRPSYKYPHAKKGDAVRVNVNNQWIHGVIIERDQHKSGQVKVLYGAKLYWFHLDNALAITMDMSHCNNNDKRIQTTFPQLNINTVFMPLIGKPVQKKPTKPVQSVPFVGNMKYHQVAHLAVNYMVDVRDKYGQWFGATITAKTPVGKLSIHYNGWDAKYDETIDSRYGWNRFAKYESISVRQSTKFDGLTTGDFIDVNPMQRHPGWKIGEITSKHCGQIQVEYMANNKSYIHWVHSDDTEECAAFREKSSLPKKTDADSLFFESLRRSDYNITEVRDLSDNDTVYEAILKKKLKKQNKKREDVEQYLWHGAKNVKNLEYILKNGFDRSFNSTSKFGKGTYFAKHSCYSVRNGYCGRDKEGVSYVLLCKVIVGEYTVGTSNMSTIAKKPDGSEYDSLVNTMDNPTVFVVWRDYHAVPCRLVKFVYK